jgi:hypothetical protein
MNDFSKLDFDKLWRGRRKVTEVETSIILSLIVVSPKERVCNF